MQSMNSLVCPYCNLAFSLNPISFEKIPYYSDISENLYIKNFTDKYDYNAHYYSNSNWKKVLEFRIALCPECNQPTVFISNFCKEGLSEENIRFRTVIPKSSAKKFPDYIPKAIKEDYEEAYAITELSPKASATLSRRCLQGMIRDFHGITNKDSLYEEIKALKDLVPTKQWKAIDALRQTGNIGAHMKKDINKIIEIDPHEAENLIKLIEYLIKYWYIQRHEEQELYDSIVQTNESKKS